MGRFPFLWPLVTILQVKSDIISYLVYGCKLLVLYDRFMSLKA